MHAEQHFLATAFPDQRDRLQTLCRENPLFARKVQEYEALSASIDRVEAGLHSVAAAMLAALQQERAALREDIAAELKRTSGSCCGGCCG